MNYQEFCNLLVKNDLLSPIWQKVCQMLSLDISEDDVLCFLLLYFSFIDDGNTCMLLDENGILNRFLVKCQGRKVLYGDNPKYNILEYDVIYDNACEFVKKALNLLNDKKNSSIFGEYGLFVIKDDYIYTRKYYEAKTSIEYDIRRLFKTTNTTFTCESYENWLENKSSFNLSFGQKKAIEEGINKNLIITGGPGTGKTTSILFLLISLLLQNSEYEIYLAAPSGKASGRMKESILGGISRLKEEFILNNNDIIEKIKKSNEATIHRLLAYSSMTNTFSKNRSNQFDENSIFIIDEASMIDINIFSSLLEAIPTNAKLFIMGDKNQLPSVDCGAVFGDLLKMDTLKDNIVALDVSIRFSDKTKIYALANAINNNQELPVSSSEWKNYDSFKIEEDNFVTKPIYYYLDNDEKASEEEIIKKVVGVWAKHFYKNLQGKASNLSEYDLDVLKTLESEIELSRILTAENEGLRGNIKINELVKNLVIDKTYKSEYNGYYPGMIIMITKNNTTLEVYNGDTGIIVSFAEDDTLYLMLKKTSKFYTEDGKRENKIFKLGEYLFYPVRLFASDEITLAYTISIHKSQGSDFKNILVILPKKKGHPLLTREIVYTAITRTKGNTYILSNQERLEEGKCKTIERMTNIK